MYACMYDVCVCVCVCACVCMRACMYNEGLEQVPEANYRQGFKPVLH